MESTHEKLPSHLLYCHHIELLGLQYISEMPPSPIVCLLWHDTVCKHTPASVLQNDIALIKTQVQW